MTNGLKSTPRPLSAPASAGSFYPQIRWTAANGWSCLSLIGVGLYREA
jgi:hypothetical protein